MEDLFLAPTDEFIKSASGVELPEDPNQWPQEILQEFYKQVPYISEYRPDVQMDRVDAEKKYGFGHIAVSSKSEVPMNGSPAGAAAANVRTVRIPVIVKDGVLEPFDVMVTEDSKMLPLTETRLRQALFRPQMFDVTAQTPGDHSLVGQLYPPFRQNYGMGGNGSVVSTGMDGGGGGKLASLLAVVTQEVREEDLQKVAEVLADERVAALALSNKFATAGALRHLANASPTQEKNASARSREISWSPDVFQVSRTAPGTYVVKTASHSEWDPQERVLDRGTLVREYGVKLALDVDTAGAVTAATGNTVAGTSDLNDVDSIRDYGLYKVRTVEGDEVVGYVFPNLLDIDGTPLPLALFTNGTAAAVQGDIIGVRAGDGMALPQGGQPRGYGVFYRLLPNGKAEATIPLDIQASISMGGEVAFQAKTFDGAQVEVVGFQPNIQQLTLVDNKVLVPESYRWLPLNKANEVTLLSTEQPVDTKQAAARYGSSVTVRAGGFGSYSVSGYPVEKLASYATEDLSLNETLFLLGGLGVDMGYAQAKLAEAAQWSHPTEVRVGRHLHEQASVKIASEEDMPVHKMCLVKEALAIPDPLAVDAVLSLNFLNPENFHSFLEALPLLDAAQGKMCELLVATRLGLRDVPQAALENALRSIEQVIEGLRLIAFQKN
jgi:hypothetical protein